MEFEGAVIVLITLTVYAALVTSTKDGTLPIFEVDSNRMQRRVESKNLFTFEKTLRKKMVGANAPSEVFAFASSGSFDFFIDLFDKPVTPKELMVITVRGATAELRWSSDHGKTYRQRKLTKNEIAKIHTFVRNEGVDQLPLLGGTRIIDGKEEEVVGGTIYVYLHLSQLGGRRVLINNPPERDDDKFAPDDPIRKYTTIVEFFNALKKPENPDAP